MNDTQVSLKRKNLLSVVKSSVYLRIILGAIRKRSMLKYQFNIVKGRKSQSTHFCVN